MIRCQYDDIQDGQWAECGQPALEVTIQGPGGAYDYELCPKHLMTIVSDRGWWQALGALLSE